MPSVNPVRLAQQVQRLADLLPAPLALQRAAVELFDYYADRTRRSGRRSGAHLSPRAFGAPTPVVRAAERAIAAAARERPECAWPAAQTLWNVGYRETSLLAIALLAALADDGLGQWAAKVAAECRDPIVLEALADGGLSAWRRADPSRFLRAARSWLRPKESAALQAFALLALRAAVRDLEFEDLPGLIKLMHGLAARVRGERLRALQELVQALAQRSPPEAARFLLDELRKGGEPAARLAKRSLEAFPARYQQTIRRALLR